MGIFSRSDGPDELNGIGVDSFVVVYDDGQFCLVRVTVSPAQSLSDEGVELRVASGRRSQRFLPTERRSFAQSPADGRVAEFVLPSLLLESHSFELAVGDATIELPTPAQADDGGLPATRATIADAFLAQQNLLAEQAGLIAALRDDLRLHREAAEQAEAQLAEARQASDARVRELESELSRARQDGGRSAAPAPERTAEISDLAGIELFDPDGGPAVGRDELPAFGIDALAEAYAVALDAWRTRDRGGDHAQALRWRDLARAIVAEAAGRSGLRDDPLASSSGRVRHSDRRRARLRAQLRDAAIARG